MYNNILVDEFKEWSEFLLMHQFAVEEIRTKLENLDSALRLSKDYNPIEHIRYRVKQPKSIVEKLKRMGFEPTIENAKEQLFDVAGIRITCAFINDIYTVYDMISSRKEFEIIKLKDYIQNPKANGYKSLHVIMKYPVYFDKNLIYVNVELQIRTIAMDFWASLEHKIYYKYREEMPDMIKNELKNCADLIATLEDRMYGLKRIITFKDSHLHEK